MEVDVHRTDICQIVALFRIADLNHMKTDIYVRGIWSVLKIESTIGQERFKINLTEM